MADTIQTWDVTLDTTPPLPPPTVRTGGGPRGTAMQARITPKDRPGFVVDAKDCRYSDSMQGGYKDATFAADIPEDMQYRMLDAEVVLMGPNRPVWAGRVYSYDKGSVRANGWQECMTRTPRAAVYVDTSLDSWVPCWDPIWYPGEGWSLVKNENIWNVGGSIQLERALQIHFGDNWTTRDLKRQGWVYRFPVATASGAVLRCYYTNKGEGIPPEIHGDILIGDTTNVYTVPGGVDWESAWTASGTSASNTEISVTLPGSGGGSTFQYLAVTAHSGAATSLAVTDNPMITFILGITDGVNADPHGHGVFGVADCVPASYDCLTVSDILDDCLDELPTWALPTGSQYRAWLETDSTAIMQCAHDMATEAERVNEFMQKTERYFVWRMKLVGGQWACVPCLTTPSTTPDLNAVIGSSVTDNLTAAPLDTLATTVRAKYRDWLGKIAYVDVTDTDTSHYLVKVGSTRTVMLDGEFGSYYDATLSASAYLTELNTATSTGGLPVTGSITVSTVLGTTLPCEIEAGQLIRITGTSYGTVTARIREADHEDAGKVTLTLDTVSDVADRLRILLSRKNSRLLAT